MKFTESRLEQAIIELLDAQGYPYTPGADIARSEDEVLIEEDLRKYLFKKYQHEKLTSNEVDQVILKLKSYAASDLYESNKAIMRLVSEGFILKREDYHQKDLYVQLIDYTGLPEFHQPDSQNLPSIATENDPVYLKDNNIYRFVNQFEITGYEKRIPDGILFINGLPVVVFEFKTAIKENTTIHDAYVQLTTRYKRDIPELFKYNAFCVISDGVNNKSGSFFAPYEYYYAWRKIEGKDKDLPVPGPGDGEFCVYILQCSDGSFYKGQTKDLRRRIKEHNEGKVSHTSKNLPVDLIHWEYYHSREEAVKRERNLKTGYGRTWLKRSFKKKSLAKWARQTGVDGIDSLHSMIKGMFDKNRLRDIIRNFILMPDSSTKNEKILCRYPQYYGAKKLFQNIIEHQKPDGDGKGGTYFGATGSGKSYTMLFLTRLLMRSKLLSNPTIVLITDRTDLDDQLAEQFTNAKEFIGDSNVISVESREELRQHLRNLKSGGVFLTTIHKFTEDTRLLTKRSNVICISDEAHRSQVNLKQKVKVTDSGVKKTYGFAKYLHDSLPNATYVGFTGTPIDDTINVFGEIVDSYTMTESVKDGITVRIVYEGRAAKVLLNNSELQKIEDYYNQCAEEGTNDYQIEESKKAVTNMNVILGDPDRLKALAEDFVNHYEKRIKEGASVKGKAMFVCSNRTIAFNFYKNLIALRPEWAEVRTAEPEAKLTEKEKREIKPMAMVKMVMTRGQDDPKELYDMIGTKEYRKELDRQFKNEKSNFKIALVVDMWLTGFDVPFLDTIYIDKPIQRHNLIQTISRVNRNFKGKKKGLVVDYIGIKKQMNMALAHYNKKDSSNFEDIEQSVVVVKDHLDLLAKIFHKFDSSKYYHGSPVEQLNTLNMAAEYVQVTQDLEKRFMFLVKRLKAAYDICAASELLSQQEKDQVHFYLAVRSIVFKLTKGSAPDTAQMNQKVRDMIKDALTSEGVEEIFKLNDDKNSETDIFDEDYLAKINKIKLPNTRIKLLQQLLNKAIEEFKKVNRVKGIDFTEKMQQLVNKYNERKESDVLRSEVLEDFTDEIIDLYHALKKEKASFNEMGIDFEEKAFYDILKSLTVKYDFDYPEEKLIKLSKAVKEVVDDKAKYTDWSKRDDIKAELKADLIVLLAENNYPPIDRDEVYKEIFEQAENFKKYQQ